MTSASLARANSPYEQLISQMILIERQPQFELTTQKREHERLKGVLKDFDSKLSALHMELKSLIDPLASPFDGRGVEGIDDAAGFSIAAGDDATRGAHTLEVLRLARADTRVSRQLAASGSSLESFFGGSSKSFTLHVAQPTDEDPGHRVAIDVTVSPRGGTNAEILEEIRAATNKAIEMAVENGILDATYRPHASVVNETADTARLSLRGGRTGYAHRFTFTDTDGLLAELELNASTTSGDTYGGQLFDVGTDETESALNSHFVLDGLTLYRSGNKVTDALQGVTIDLKKTGESERAFRITTDTENIEKTIETFIEKYNEVLTHIENKAAIDADSDKRGDFAGDRTFTGLRMSMRSDAIRAVPGLPAEAPQSLTDLGITTARDGTLALGDKEALQKAVEQNASAVQHLFSGEDGVATWLKERLDEFVGVKGIIKSREEVIDTRIRRLDNRITSWDKRLEQREEQLREQFVQLQETISVVQGQQEYLLNFFGFGYI